MSRQPVESYERFFYIAKKICLHWSRREGLCKRWPGTQKARVWVEAKKRWRDCREKVMGAEFEHMALCFTIGRRCDALKAVAASRLNAHSKNSQFLASVLANLNIFNLHSKDALIVNNAFLYLLNQETPLQKADPRWHVLKTPEISIEISIQLSLSRGVTNAPR